MSSVSIVSATLVFAAGDTVLIPTGAKSHLFVAVYGSQLIGGVQKVLLVPFSTVVPKCDQSCPVNIGDHSFIVRPSFMSYVHARNELLNHVAQCLVNGSYNQGYPAVSTAVLTRIQAGYSATKRVPRTSRKNGLSRSSV